ncbi:hypothetical protein C9374_006718 [Naegleria lovaniensis]|uniref:Uncharacterized protein n=1 Tax=Naegleria lovaniensis TaxID=51637 RepID=A0AA88KIW1_NAELO|nr:uncharacterized protein C9374_006718 [Naegleria lovaniensis]KAG2379601.1 hypothetical protein C9374_006718 [Naegleria lovaniensis]
MDHQQPYSSDGEYSSSSNNNSSNNNTTPTKSKAGEFGRPLIPFFIDGTNNNGTTPTGGYSVNEDLFLTDEQAQQQQRVFVPKGEKSIRVREFKDGYFEYKDLSLDTVKDKLTFDARNSSSSSSINNNNNSSSSSQQPNFFAQHVTSPPQSDKSAASDNGLGKKSRTSTKDHFANYERMVVPYQHYNTTTKSNDNSSGDENMAPEKSNNRDNKPSSHLNGENIGEDDENQRDKKKKKKVMVPVNVQKQSISNSSNSNSGNSGSSTALRSVLKKSPSSARASSSNDTNISTNKSSVSTSSNAFPQSSSTVSKASPSTKIISNVNSSTNVDCTKSTSGATYTLLTPSYFNTSERKRVSIYSPSEGLLKPTWFPSWRYFDMAYLESTVLKDLEEKKLQTPPHTSLKPLKHNTPNAPMPSSPPFHHSMPQLGTSASSTSLTEEELLSSLINDGSVIKLDPMDNSAKKGSASDKKFAGGSWSNSPHPSKLPKPLFNH